jgi:hypothetical protein
MKIVQEEGLLKILSAKQNELITMTITICSQYINEKGYSMDEVQMMTDHARRESVKRYASVQLEEKRRLLEGKQGRNL